MRPDQPTPPPALHTPLLHNDSADVSCIPISLPALYHLPLDIHIVFYWVICTATSSLCISFVLPTPYMFAFKLARPDSGIPARKKHSSEEPEGWERGHNSTTEPTSHAFIIMVDYSGKCYEYNAEKSSADDQERIWVK